MNSGGGGRTRKPRNSNMSHNSQRYNRGRDRPHQDRPPVEASGVYADAKYAHLLTSVLGCSVRVRTPSDVEYEGVLESVSRDNCFVLGMVNPVDQQRPNRIDPAEVRDKLIFRTEQIVSIHCPNVDMEFATKSGFATDSSITGRTNGSGAQRELQPWVSGDDVTPPGQLVSLEEANGWDARDMFRQNERMYGVRSTFDQTLAGYTVPLESVPSEQAERAARIAQEIERSAHSRHRAELENGDEEAAFAAVARPGGGGDARNDRYVPPARRPMRENAGPRQSPRGGPAMSRPRGGPPQRPPMHHGRDMRDGREFRDARDRELRDNRDSRDRELRDGRDGRDGREIRDGREFRDGRDSRDRELRDNRDRGGSGRSMHARASPSASTSRTASVSEDRPSARPTPSPTTPTQPGPEAEIASNEVQPTPPAATVAQDASPAMPEPPRPQPKQTSTQSATETSRSQRGGDARASQGATPPVRGPASSAAKTVAGLKDFQENFVLSEEPAPAKTQTDPPTSRSNATPATPTAEGAPSTPAAAVSAPAAATTTATSNSSPSTPTTPSASNAESKLVDSLAKSKLNPNAKEFTMNPNAKSFTPSFTPSAMPAVTYSPDPPMPRAVTPQAAITPGQLSILNPQTGQPATISYFMGPHSFPMQQQIHQPPRLQKQRGDYSSMAGHRGGEASPMQVAAVTGQPLLAPSPLATHPPAQQIPMPMQQGGMMAHPYPGGQMIVRMMPTGHASVYQPQPGQPGPGPQQHSHPQPHPSSGGYEPQPGPPPGPHSLPYGLLPQPQQGQPTAATGPALLYQIQTPTGTGAYPPSSMYLLPGGQQVPPHLMMQPAVTSSMQTLPLSVHQLPQQYYFPQQQHPSQQPQPPQTPQYGGPAGHPMPLVPHINH